MNILVGGSNRYLPEKEALVKFFNEASHQAKSTYEIFHANNGGKEGDEAIKNWLRYHASIFYVVTGQDGYTGLTTTLLMGFAQGTNIVVPVYANLPLFDEDYTNWYEVRSPEELIK